MARMKIFNTLEQEEFDSPPVFNSADRKRFFSLPTTLNDSAEELRTSTNKVCFLVLAGYFKARRKFFNRQFSQADIEFVADQFGFRANAVHLKAYSKETHARHQRAILNNFGYSAFDAAARKFTVAEITRLVTVQFRPKWVLLEIFEVLSHKKIEIPSYHALATLIVAAVNRYQRALSKTVDDCLIESQRGKLDALLDKEPGIGGEDGWRYRLTLLKKPNQSTKPSKIKANLADQQSLQELYFNLLPIVQRLGLRNRVPELGKWELT